MFRVMIETPNGSSLAATDRALRFVESRLQAMPEVKSYFSNLGRGNPQIFYNMIPTEDAPNYAEVFVQLRRLRHAHDAAAARGAAAGPRRGIRTPRSSSTSS